ncbi:hypothetical protein K466DRAFT_603830 [Polyporus arcularius HHB13444]|uniref:Uncharacterized protein n=1 Tax=Polyporus arcularius HHB13444 TaxID=1314778 RepID=A0A5C3NXX6_9APHY|nr:hypothetical protein K466DRAFT_603830 [Polyporus arcularius HHB13444]
MPMLLLMTVPESCMVETRACVVAQQESQGTQRATPDVGATGRPTFELVPGMTDASEMLGVRAPGGFGIRGFRSTTSSRADPNASHPASRGGGCTRVGGGGGSSVVMPHVTQPHPAGAADTKFE